MTGSDLVLIGGTLLLYAVVSRRLERTIVSAPMIFVTVGVLIGPDVFDLVDAGTLSIDVGLLAEVALSLILFTDASSLDTRRLEHQRAVPVRLLVVALPLTIVLGGLTAVVTFEDLVLFEAVALAVILAPTDAALGEAVVSDARVPSIVRQGLNVESGLNDGICVPLLLAAVAFAQLEEAPSFEGEILFDLVRELGVAVIAGGGVAFVAALLARWAGRRGWMAERWAAIVPLATTIVAYAATNERGGSGFIAAFVAGLVYGRMLGAAAHRTTELTEDLGQVLSAVTFLLFGATVVGGSIQHVDVETIVYAALSLTLVRMIPVTISLLGVGAAPPTIGFIGWFGPRGLASIVFALTVVDESDLLGADRIIDVTAIVVVASVFAHGMSATGLTARYAAWIGANRDRLRFEAADVDVGSHHRAPRAHWWTARSD